jgi:hypothetical protein
MNEQDKPNTYELALERLTKSPLAKFIKVSENNENKTNVGGNPIRDSE